MIKRMAWLLPIVVTLSLSACSDDDPPPRGSVTWTIPTETSLEDAVNQAGAGDTLIILSAFPTQPVTETLVITNTQTPLVIMGDKFPPPVIFSPDSITVLKFDSPNLGTHVVDVGFSGGANSIEVSGGGSMLIERCSFSGAAVQVRVNGTNLTTNVQECLMRDALFFSVITENRATAVITNTTIDSAGDCGINLTQNTVGEVRNCIISNSVNYGIACNENAILSPMSDCNDVYNSGTLPYFRCTDGAASFTLDPLFCGGGDFHIDTASPCAPDNSNGCELIGAFDVVVCNP